jgi:hypothetical protein
LLPKRPHGAGLIEAHTGPEDLPLVAVLVPLDVGCKDVVAVVDRAVNPIQPVDTPAVRKRCF